MATWLSRIPRPINATTTQQASTQRPSMQRDQPVSNRTSYNSRTGPNSTKGQQIQLNIRGGGLGKQNTLSSHRDSQSNKPPSHRTNFSTDKENYLCHTSANLMTTPLRPAAAAPVLCRDQSTTRTDETGNDGAIEPITSSSHIGGVRVCKCEEIWEELQQGVEIGKKKLQEVVEAGKKKLQEVVEVGKTELQNQIKGCKVELPGMEGTCKKELKKNNEEAQKQELQQTHEMYQGLLKKRDDKHREEMQKKEEELQKKDEKLQKKEIELQEATKFGKAAEAAEGEQIDLNFLMDGRLDEFGAQLRARERENENLKAEIGSRSTEIEYLQSQLGEKNGTLTEMQDRLTSLSTKVGSLRSQLREKNNTLAELKDTVTCQSTQIMTFQSQLGKKDDILAELKDKVASQSTQIMTFQSQLGAKDDMLAELTHETRYQSEQISYLRSSLDNKNDELTVLQDRLTSTRLMYQQTRASHILLRATQQRNRQLQAKLQRSQVEVGVANDRVAQASNINQCLQSHIMRLNDRVHTYITMFVYILIYERTTAAARRSRELLPPVSETSTIVVVPSTDATDPSVSPSSTCSENSSLSPAGSGGAPPRKAKGDPKWVRNDKRNV